MKALVLGAFLLVASAIPAQAASVTIDGSTGCSNCFGLTWTLTINTGSYQAGAYTYEAILDVADDPAITGTPTNVISAVDFKVSSSVTGATLYTAPTGGWTTSLQGVSSGGCGANGSGFVCSQSATAAPYSALRTWGWYFNTNSPIFPGLDGAHIGAKMVALGTPGRLLSETATAQVPEPASLSLLGAGAFGLATVLARRRRRSAKR
jgi:hypothetical protein